MKENSINNWEDMTIKHTNNRIKRNPTILDKNMATKKYNEKAEWINNITRELERLEEGMKAEIHTYLLKTLLKTGKLKNARPWWNTWFLVQEIHLHTWQTGTRNE